MGRIEELVARYERYIALPWQKNLAGPQRTIFVVYDKADEKKLRAKIGLFELVTKAVGHGWRGLDLTATFAQWMAAMDYREAYFEEPADLQLKLDNEFIRYAAGKLRAAITASDADESTVVAVSGVASLYGFTKVSLVLKEVVNEVKGRLLLFFPGQAEDNNYRLLDARDGWNYLAIPITLHSGVKD